MPSIEIAANNEERNRELETPEMTASLRRYKSELTAWYRRGHAENTCRTEKRSNREKARKKNLLVTRHRTTRGTCEQSKKTGHEINRKRTVTIKLTSTRRTQTNKTPQPSNDEAEIIFAHTCWNLMEKVPQRQTTGNDAAKRNAIRTSVRIGQGTGRWPVMSRRRPSHS